MVPPAGQWTMRAQHRLLRAARTMFAICTSACLAACTIVKVDGPAEISRVYPGIIKIAPADGSAMVAYRARGLGLVPGRNGVTLGYASESAVVMGAEDECRIVLFEPDPQTVSELASLLHGVVEDGQICSVGGSQ